MSYEVIFHALRLGDDLVGSLSAGDDELSRLARGGELILAELDGASPEQVCEAVLEDAARAYGGADDVTVLAVKIRAALTLR